MVGRMIAAIGRTLDAVARWRNRWRHRVFADVLSVPYRWLRKPGDLAGQDVCLFVTHAPGGRVPEHALVHAAAWAEHGFRVVLVAATDEIAAFAPDPAFDAFAGILVRANAGYDFAAWAAAIRLVPGITAARTVAIANDSVYGPLDSFTAMLDRLRAAPADVVGLVESREIRRHLQSFVLVFKGAAPASGAFHDFWHGVRIGDRAHAIDRYELPLAARMEAGGLSATALFAATGAADSNPSLTRWRNLVAEGFPFIKVQLLRDNPRDADLAGWPEFVAARGYDPAIIIRHLAGQTPRERPRRGRARRRTWSDPS